MKILIVGSGKLANALLGAELQFDSCEMLKWEPQHSKLTEQAIVVHAGSGRQLPECLAFCARTGSVFVELSTGLETESMEPEFPLIICPNTSILVLKTLNLLKIGGHVFEKYDISITESHQAAKTTEPGTAYSFAHSLQIPIEQISSVRIPDIQLNTIGIPAEYIGKHAYHKIVIKDGTDEVTIETKVLGHESYAQGVKKIVEAVLQFPLENKRYTVLDLIGCGML